MSDNYHHGDLRNALIETGIRIVNECGEKGLSLRKLAAACGVSNAAPYAHFSGKEELIQAMQEYVTEKFTGRLQEAIDRKADEGAEQMILAMGKAYVLFFVENPTYFTFCHFFEFMWLICYKKNYPTYNTNNCINNKTYKITYYLIYYFTKLFHLTFALILISLSG